jgi:hypothetical protein
MDRLSKRKSRVILVFTCAVLIVAVVAEKYLSHRILWLIVLAASIPLFAAIIGGIPESTERDQT